MSSTFILSTLSYTETFRYYLMQRFNPHEYRALIDAGFNVESVKNTIFQLVKLSVDLKLAYIDNATAFNYTWFAETLGKEMAKQWMFANHPGVSGVSTDIEHRCTDLVNHLMLIPDFETMCVDVIYRDLDDMMWNIFPEKTWQITIVDLISEENRITITMGEDYRVAEWTRLKEEGVI